MNRVQLMAWAVKHAVPPAALVELYGMLGLVAVAVRNEAHAAASESGVSACVALEVDRWGGAAWRNNSGACVDSTGRQVRYGLANDSKRINEVFKSSDRIGLVPGSGRFLAVECKPRGWRYRGTDREVAQLNFMQRVRDLGGVACFATCVDDVARAINEQ